MTKVMLSFKKTTDNKVVFGEQVDEDSFEFALIPALYLDKRDIQRIGITPQLPRLEVTIKAVPAA
jgi:hypothetical protein